MIDVSGSSAVRINAMDMEKGYADNDKNPLADKSELDVYKRQQPIPSAMNPRSMHREQA